MASLVQASCSLGAVYSFSRGVAVPQQERRGGARSARVFQVRADGTDTATTSAPINPSIKKDSDKVVDTVVAGELQKPLTAYCRCWRSGTFPLCDGTHVKHNKATGDNVGPLLLKK
ncbi:hypothetical protein R1sor_014585 [Riccia sorocarpa]|uniref:Iron-binding zinc finger CDGSH type domain-containing protein n=1 Tax=Riccia sorocarpa TaxID=122646 RepID=A0ABD3HBN8_9MARC